jgi:hypothetical protein
MKHASALFVILLFLPHCKPKEEVSISAADREMLSSLREIQVETKLSDEELTQAVGRYCKIFRVMECAINDGLITMEDYSNMTANIKEVQDNMLESDSMAAAVCLGVLKSSQEGRAESFNVQLRKMLARYYQDILERDEEDHRNFRKKVEDYAASDEELRQLLKKQS